MVSTKASFIKSTLASAPAATCMHPQREANIHTFVKTEKNCSEVLVYSAEIINREINLVMGVGWRSHCCSVP